MLSDYDDGYLYMKDAEGFLNAESQLNTIGGLYKTEIAEEARSVNVGDINEITGITTKEKIKEVDVTPLDFGGKQYGEEYTAENKWTPETWIDGKNTEGGTASTRGKIKVPIDGYMYEINSNKEGRPSATVSNAKAFELLFNDVDYSSGQPYWLASHGNRDLGIYLGYGIGVVYRWNFRNSGKQFVWVVLLIPVLLENVQLLYAQW